MQCLAYQMQEALTVNKLTWILNTLRTVNHADIFRSKLVVQVGLPMQMVALQRDFLMFVKNMLPKVPHQLLLDLWNGRVIFQRLNGNQVN